MKNTEFNGFLMPSSFLRRWQYNELIPSLLYCDRITFLMDDIEGRYVSEDPSYQIAGQPPVRLHSPQELSGVPDTEIIDGLTAEQHRYYWPMRDLMSEGVIAITSKDLGWLGPKEVKELDELQHVIDDQKHPQHWQALDYLSAASRYYDIMTNGRNNIHDSEKARKIYLWIKDSLSIRQSGWQRVMLDPSAFIVVQKAIQLFPSLHAMHINHRFDDKGALGQGEALLATTVTADLLNERLPTYALADDPAALSEILTVRERRRNELEAFRSRMMEAANDLQLSHLDADQLVERVANYARRVRPLFKETSRALGDKWHFPKLIFRKVGAILTQGVLVGLGTVAAAYAAGPAAALFGFGFSNIVGKEIGETLVKATSEGVGDGLKEVIGEVGAETSKVLSGSNKQRVDASLAFLFYADKDLKNNAFKPS